MKEKIMKVAKELFIKNGYNLTTTSDIVKLSGSSKGNLYHHFNNKENLFLEIIKDEETKWEEIWRNEEKKCQTNKEKIMRINELAASKDYYYYSLQLAIFEFYSNENKSKNTVEKLNEIEEHYLKLLMDILEEGNKAKEWDIVDLKLASQTVSATITGTILLSLNETEEQRKKQINYFSKIFLNGISKPEE